MTPELSALNGFLGALVGGGITALTTYLIARSERTKFARERLWDLRRDAYTQIIASILPAARVAQDMHRGFQQNAEAYGESEDVRQAAAEYGSHLRAVRDAFHLNRLMLSPAFAKVFSRMMEALDGVGSDPHRSPEAAEMAGWALSGYRQDLLDLALSEITAARSKAAERTFSWPSGRA